MSESFTMNRRSFLTLTVTATGALLLRFPLTATAAAASTSEFLTGYLEITPDNQLYLQLNRHEMGQGVAEGLRTLLAEELGTAPHLIRFRLLNVGPNQLNPYSHPENTGGSFSMRSSWQPVRQAGAYCRALLLKAGELTLQQAGINGADRTLKLQDGQVVGGGRNLPFAHLAPFMEEARKLVDPAKAKPLAPPWRYIGHSSSRTLNLEKVTGALQYGYDRSVALVAVIAHPDRPGAKLSHHDRKAALAVPGVKYVEVLQAGVAVVASSTWAALRGRDALQVRWEGGEDLSSDSMEKVLTQLLERNELRHTVVKQGADFTGAPALERIYRLPMLAHAPMEPLACTVSVGMDHCVIHAGTQRPDAVLDLAARVTGIHRDQIQLQDEMSGGSFGRRLSPDYVVEALELGVRLQLPVKVIWDREDQFLAAHFRPPAVIRLRGFAGADGRLAGLQHQIVSPAKLWYELPYLQTGWKEEIKQVLYGLLELRRLLLLEGGLLRGHQVDLPRIDAGRAEARRHHDDAVDDRDFRAVLVDLEVEGRAADADGGHGRLEGEVHGHAGGGHADRAGQHAEGARHLVGAAGIDHVVEDEFRILADQHRGLVDQADVEGAFRLGDDRLVGDQAVAGLHLLAEGARRHLVDDAGGGANLVVRPALARGQKQGQQQHQSARGEETLHGVLTWSFA